MNIVEWTGEIPDEPDGWEFVGWEYVTKGNGAVRCWLEIDTPWPPELKTGERLFRQSPVFTPTRGE